MNNRFNHRRKDLTDAGDTDRKTSRADEVFAACVILFMVLSYIIADIFLEMYTEHIDRTMYISCAAAVFVVLTYFCIKYIGFKRIAMYLSIVIGTALLSVILAISLHGVKMVYYAFTGNTITTRLTIKKVEKVTYRRSFYGSKVFVDYDHQEICLESSRVNYFALRNKKSMLADIGKAGTGNYYITKVYWEGSQKADARKAYWHDWFKKALVTIEIIAGVLVVGFLFGYIKSKLSLKTLNFFTRLSSWQVILLVMGGIFALFLIIIFLIYAYLLIRYGRIGRY